MNFRTYLLAMMFLAGVLATSCAVTPEEDTYFASDRVMKSWIKVNYPGISPYGDTGAYILEMDPGSGPAVSDTAFIRAHYVKRRLDASITATNIQQLAEQIGSYTATTYYGGNTWQVGKGYLPDALETVLKTMRSGGHVKLALPMSASDHEFSLYNAFSGTSESDNLVIDLTIDTVLTDIYAYQEKTMRAWFQEHYASTDTVVEGLYFKKLVERLEANDTIPEGNNVSVRYIGRTLDGRVFDTNIEDTAKFYRIWNSSKTYNAMSISYYKEDESKFGSENSVVGGFGKAIQQMNYGEKAAAVFNSRLGYEEKGSSPSIPEYAPLYFWLYIEPKK